MSAGIRGLVITVLAVGAGCSSSPTTSSSTTTGGLGSFGAGAGANGASTGGNGATGGSVGSIGAASGSGATSGGGGALDQTCGEAGQAICDFVSRCQASVPITNCAQLVTQSCEEQYGPAVAAGREVVTPSSAFDSLCGTAAVAQATCNDLSLFLIALGCSAGVTEPNVGLGGECHTSHDCEDLPDGGSVECQAPPLTCGGTCAFAAALGQPCDSAPSYLGCEQGYCSFPTDGGSGSCVAYGEQGASCATIECDPAQSYCDYSTGTPLCQALLAPGTACEGQGCGPGYYCGSPDGGFEDELCLAQTALGQPCNPGQFGHCLGNSQCVTAGFCAPYQGEPGDPCDTTTTNCEDDSSCVGEGPGPGTCTAFDAGPQPGLGSHCSGPMDDEQSCGDSLGAGASISGLYRCVNGICTALPSPGQPCSALGHCISGALCVAGTCQLAPAAGANCLAAFGTNACANGYCDPVTSVCHAYLAAGAACVPSELQCGNTTHDFTEPDGGYGQLDAQCGSPTGGSPTCQPPCD